MAKVNQGEIESSIDSLAEYRKRLTNEVLDLAKKLKMPKAKTQETLDNHKELKRINEAITRLSQEIRLLNQ